jgi:RNA polymerase sigma factor FliA
LCRFLVAVEACGPSRPAEFETYAILRTRWSILDKLRKSDPRSRTARLRAQRVERVRCGLAERYGWSPTEPELATTLGVTLADRRPVLETISRSKVGSLEAVDGWLVEDRLHELVVDHLASDPERAVERSERWALFVRAVQDLGEKVPIITTFYYCEGLTLREMGGALGLTDGGISQILRVR